MLVTGTGSMSAHGLWESTPDLQNEAVRIRPSGGGSAALFMFTDLALMWIGTAIVLWVRVSMGAISFGQQLKEEIAFLLLFSVLVALSCHAQSLYHRIRHHHGLREILAILKSVGFGIGVAGCFIYLLRQEDASGIALGAAVASATVALVINHLCWRNPVARQVATGLDCSHVLILGHDDTANMLAVYLDQHRQLGYFTVGQTYEGRRDLRRRIAMASRVGTGCEVLSEVIRAKFVDELIIALPADHDLVQEALETCRRLRVGVRLIPDLHGGMVSGAALEYVGPYPSLEIHNGDTHVVGLLLKRCIDVVASSLLLVSCSPLLALLAVLIHADSPGPAFYASERVGKKGRHFRFYKLRSMVTHADELQGSLWGMNERCGVLFKVNNDPRITRVGRLLRKYSLDELPQLWNVLKGDMSLVGPRPALPSEVAKYGLEDLKRLEVTPGITGLWQVEARNDPSFARYIDLDTQYLNKWSLWLDFKILFKTIIVTFAGTGQ